MESSSCWFAIAWKDFVSLCRNTAYAIQKSMLSKLQGGAIACNAAIWKDTDHLRMCRSPFLLWVSQHNHRP